MNARDYLIAEEIAERLFISLERTRHYIRTGKIGGAYKVGREYRVSISDIESFEAELKKPIITEE